MWNRKKTALFSGHYLRNRSTLDVGVLGYIGILLHKQHPPEVWHIPPVIFCIYIYRVSQEECVTRGYFPGDKATHFHLCSAQVNNTCRHTYSHLYGFITRCFIQHKCSCFDSAPKPGFVYFSFSRIFTPKLIGMLSCHLILNVASEFHDGSNCTYFYFSLGD